MSLLLSILRKDFARYNEEGLTQEEKAEASREMREETGWKLVYAGIQKTSYKKKDWLEARLRRYTLIY